MTLLRQRMIEDMQVRNLAPKLLDTLRDYWRIVRSREWLFPGYLGQPITTHAVEHACRKARLRAGIPGPNATAPDYTNPRCS
jgi:integrase